MEIAHNNDQAACSKALEKTEAYSPRKSRIQEIIDLRAEIHKIKTQKTKQRINETEFLHLIVLIL